jgi:probable rRNA maturation factor
MPREIELFVDYPGLTCDSDRIIQMIESAIDCIDAEFPDGDLSIALMADSRLAELHKAYLDDPTPTDVITFPGDPDMEFAGEICVSVDRALAVSAEQSNPFHLELTLYIVHGLLHLAGWNDKTPDQIKKMRLAERMVLAKLEALQLIPDFAIA